MHQCCVFGCRNQGNHTFPKDQIVRKLWEAAIPTRDNNMYIAKKYSKICPAHFKPQDFIKYGRFSGLVNTRRILKKGIVPSIFQCTKWEDVKSKQRLERAEVGMVTLELEVEKKEVFVKEEPPCEYLVSEDASSLYDVHVAKDEDGMVTLQLDVVKKEVVVKEEPPCEDLGSEDVTSLYGNHVVKEELRPGPECLQQHGMVTLELDVVKKEVFVKKEPPSDGIEYADHVVNDELVLGPQYQQQRGQYPR
ncbi:uncharacterized protein LOC133531556 isoform X1 [Cydia pomonella]|uniref:uncharacterized protein LOC133531556 isoform X1 n=1 Tax=Cydia pomonella TaxID=82600 RepID=UPI002ADE1146|nr:uncharacterized protein LOC133531556 isoform X1 [Cydia pomonella]